LRAFAVTLLLFQQGLRSDPGSALSSIVGAEETTTNLWRPCRASRFQTLEISASNHVRRPSHPSYVGDQLRGRISCLRTLAVLKRPFWLSKASTNPCAAPRKREAPLIRLSRRGGVRSHLALGLSELAALGVLTTLGPPVFSCSQAMSAYGRLGRVGLPCKVALALARGSRLVSYGRLAHAQGDLSLCRGLKQGEPSVPLLLALKPDRTEAALVDRCSLARTGGGCTPAE